MIVGDRPAFMDCEFFQRSEFRILEEISDDLADGVVEDQSGGSAIRRVVG